MNILNKKKLIGAALGCLLLPALGHGQVILDTTFGGGDGIETISLGADGRSGSQSLTVGSGNDRLLVAIIQARWNSTEAILGNTISYGGTNFTEFGQSENNDDNTTVLTRFFVLDDPASGSNTLAYDFREPNGPDGRGFGITLLSLENAGSVTEFGSDSGTTSVSTVSGNALGDSMLISGYTVRILNDNDVSNTGDQTTGVIYYPNTDKNYAPIAASGYLGVDTEGSYDLEWTQTQTQAFSHYAIEVAAIPEPSAFALTAGALMLVMLVRRRRS